VDRPEILNNHSLYGHTGGSNQYIATGNSGSFTPTPQTTSVQASDYYTHPDEDVDRLEILNNHSLYSHAGGSDQYIATGSSGSFTPISQTPSVQASDYYAHTDDDVDRLEILNNHSLYSHAGGSDRYIATGNSGSFTPTPQTTFVQASNYYVHMDDDADRLEILNNHGPYIHASGSNQYIVAGSSGSFTPISQTPSVQALNYRVHRALEPNHTFTRPTPYPSELIRNVRAFRAPRTIEQERGEIMRTGVIQVGTIILQCGYALTVFQAVDDVTITAQSLHPPRRGRQPQHTLAATPGSHHQITVPDQQQPQIGAPVVTRSCVSDNAQKSIISKAKNDYYYKILCECPFPADSSASALTSVNNAITNVLGGMSSPFFPAILLC